MRIHESSGNFVRFPNSVLKKLGLTREQANRREAFRVFLRERTSALTKMQQTHLKRVMAFIRLTRRLPSGLHQSTASRLWGLFKFDLEEKLHPNAGYPLIVNPDYISLEGIERLPNVKKARELECKGFVIRTYIDLPLRCSYRCIWMENPTTGERVTVLLNGTVKQGWVKS